MPYLVKVGHFPENKSGVGSRGYHVYRRGTLVRVVWGPVKSNRKRTVSFEWERNTVHQDYRCGSVQKAIQKLQRILASRQKEGYSRIPNPIIRGAHAQHSTRRSKSR